jgi:hypothetical protein
MNLESPENTIVVALFRFEKVAPYIVPSIDPHAPDPMSFWFNVAKCRIRIWFLFERGTNSRDPSGDTAGCTFTAAERMRRTLTDEDAISNLYSIGSEEDVK